MPVWPGKRGLSTPAKSDSAEPPTARPRPQSPVHVPVLDLGDGTLVAPQPGESVNIGRSLVDICIIFDTTGSMSDKIDGLIDCMADFVDQLGKLSLNWRISVLPFGDLTVPGDRVELQWPFVKTVVQAKQQLHQMPRFSGGGNDGESSIEAVRGVIGKPWRKETVRIAVLLTDEPALEAQRSQEVLAKLRSAEIIMFVASPDLDYYKSWASGTGGKWFQIGQSMDTRALLKLLRSLVRDVAKVAADVHALAGGSYSKYLQITSGERLPKKR
jgi:von Willebrand factor type A domain